MWRHYSTLDPLRQPGALWAASSPLLLLLLVSAGAGGEPQDWTHYHDARLGVGLDVPPAWHVEKPVQSEGLTASPPGADEVSVFPVELVRWPRTAQESSADAARYHEYLLGRSGTYTRQMSQTCAAGSEVGTLVVGRLRTAEGLEHAVVFATFARGPWNYTLGTFGPQGEAGRLRRDFFDAIVRSLSWDEPPTQSREPEGAEAQPSLAATALPAEPPPAAAPSEVPVRIPPELSTEGLPVTYHDPLGYALHHPLGWSAQRKQTRLCLCEEVEHPGRLGLLWWPVMAGKRTTVGDMVLRLVEHCQDLLPKLTLTSRRRLSDTMTIVETSHRVEAKEIRGVFTCWAQGDTGCLAGIYAPKAVPPTTVALLTRALGTIVAEVPEPEEAVKGALELTVLPTQSPAAYWRHAGATLAPPEAGDLSPYAELSSWTSEGAQEP